MLTDFKEVKHAGSLLSHKNHCMLQLMGCVTLSRGRPCAVWGMSGDENSL